MLRSAFVVIEKSALRTNIQRAKQLAPGRQVYPAVKANGYGHGNIEVAQYLESMVDGFCVACVPEAEQLRRAGVVSPILVLQGFQTRQALEVAREMDLRCAVHEQQQLRILE
jgi:alanine racemase